MIAAKFPIVNPNIPYKFTYPTPEVPGEKINEGLYILFMYHPNINAFKIDS